MYEKYRAQGFEIVSISNEPSPLLRAYAKRKGATFQLLTDPANTAGSAYGVDGIPANILVGPDGHVVDGLIGFSEEEFDKHITQRIPALLAKQASR